MKLFKYFKLNFSKPKNTKFILIIFIILLNLIFNNIAQAEKKRIKYEPPAGEDQHPSQNRKAGGSRQDNCNLPSNNTIILLVPKNHIPATISPRPTFFWYVPEGIKLPMRFTLIESAGKTVFVKNQISSTPGIKSLKVPKKSSLEINKTYRWTVTVICSLEKPSRNFYASALIKRLPDSKIKLTTTTNYELAEKGIWYDALEFSYQLNEANQFKKLIEQIDLNPKDVLDIQSIISFP